MACGGDYQMGAWVVQGGKLRGGGQVRSDEGRQDPRQVQGLTCLPTHASPPARVHRAPRPAPRAWPAGMAGPTAGEGEMGRTLSST